MRLYRVQVDLKPDQIDWRGQALCQEASTLGLPPIESIRVSDLYFLAGELTLAECHRLCQELLCDPVVSTYSIAELTESLSSGPSVGHGAQVIEVCLHPGVTDAEAESLIAAARTIGVLSLSAAATGTRYVVHGALREQELRTLAERLLCNPVIQRYSLGQIVPELPLGQVGHGEKVEFIPLSAMGDDELERLSRERVLALSLGEMRAVAAHFARLGRDPTDVELETLAQTWSEHCVHKTFKALIDYEEHKAGRVERERIDGLLRTYIAAATYRLDRPWVRSAFTDNAGIIDFDEETEVSFKVETHNHPSALEPFGGANTGVGGVVRDIIGVSARPIAVTDVLCFGYQNWRFEDLPPGVLHPRRVFLGVVAGIEDYGNKMGIPTVNGAILFDDGYLANPLVYCGCVGIAPKGRHRRRAQPGDAIVMLGGRIGRDGLHGATFSSAELAADTGARVGSVVQIGNPITEKKLLEAIMIARDEGLYNAITDCGAGGLSSAVGEMGKEIGARVELEKAPLKYPGLDPWEIWLSEAQERMVLAVPQEKLPRLESICRALDVEMTVIGEFTADKSLRVFHKGRLVADLDMAFLHDGLPRRHLKAIWREPALRLEAPPERKELSHIVLALLRCPNIASKECVIRRYDHEVQGATAVKPLTGVANDGPADAAVLRPSYAAHPHRAIAIGCGLNPRYGLLDPYCMAVSAIDEALRNVVAVGADPEQTAILDNFCWGNPDLPDRLGALVRAAKGCYDAALAYGTPFISGKDSLNNEYTDPASGQRISIPPTLLISSIGIVPDVRQAVTMDLKGAENLLYVIGTTRDEMGGSHYGLVLGQDWGRPPALCPDGPEILRRLHRAIMAGLIRACHDCSEGGIGVAAAEMCIGGRLGLEMRLGDVPRSPDVQRADIILFSESNSRFLVEVAPEHAEQVEAHFAGVPFACVGRVSAEPTLKIWGPDGTVVVELPVHELVKAWQDQSYERPRPFTA